MGIWDRLRSIWENNAALDATDDSLGAGFTRNRQKFPERDANYWLAAGLSDRPKWGHVERVELLMMAAPASITAPDPTAHFQSGD